MCTYWYYNVYIWIQRDSWDQRDGAILNVSPNQFSLTQFFFPRLLLFIFYAALSFHCSIYSVFAFCPLQDLWYIGRVSEVHFFSGTGSPINISFKNQQSCCSRNNAIIHRWTYGKCKKNFLPVSFILSKTHKRTHGNSTQ